jgi:hypothetical protein
MGAPAHRQGCGAAGRIRDERPWHDLELSETIVEINDLRGFLFPHPPFITKHSQLSAALSPIENGQEISTNIGKINDLRRRWAHLTF